MNKDVELYLIHYNMNTRAQSFQELNHILIPKTPILGEFSVNRFDLDVVHFNYIPWEYRLFFPLLKPKKVATSHISIGWRGDNYSENHVNLRRVAEPIAARFLERIIAVSENLKNRLVSYLRINPSKIDVIYESVDSTVFKVIADSTFLRKTNDRYGVNNSKFVIHASNFSLRKNPLILFKSFKSLVNHGFEGCLFVAGAGWKNEYIEQLVSDLGLRDRVRFTGYIPREDLAGLFNLSEVAFFPSLHENFCFPIVEAMACGSPVVASNAYSIPEITRDAAILKKCQDYGGFADALWNILQDSNLQESLKRRGLKNANRFSEKESIEQTIQFYKKTMMTCGG